MYLFIAIILFGFHVDTPHFLQRNERGLFCDGFLQAQKLNPRRQPRQAISGRFLACRVAHRP
jgi:hypothetical protein